MNAGTITVVLFWLLVAPKNVWGLLTAIPILLMIVAEIYAKNKED